MKYNIILIILEKQYVNLSENGMESVNISSLIQFYLIILFINMLKTFNTD